MQGPIRLPKIQWLKFIPEGEEITFPYVRIIPRRNWDLGTGDIAAILGVHLIYKWWFSQNIKYMDDLVPKAWYEGWNARYQDEQREHMMKGVKGMDSNRLAGDVDLSKLLQD